MDRRRSQRIKSLRKGSCCDSDSKSDDHANNNANLWLLLPQDLMFRIFTLVPPHYLINSVRYVCKPWAAAIASSRFAEACQHFHVRSKPGLYVHNHKSKGRSYFLEFKDDVNYQFERTDLETPSKMGRVIATCDGILLLLSKTRQLFVANPILKCWLTIPSFPVSGQFRHVSYHVSCRCTIARVPHTDKFKVFFVDVLEVSGIFLYVFYVLRVGIDNSWKEIARKEAPLGSYILTEPVCNGGNALYWISKREVIVMDVDKEFIVREYPHPARAMLFDLTYLWMGDFLSCIVFGNHFLTEIYILDLDAGIWTLYHEIEMGLFYFVEACGHNCRNPISVSFRLWINNQIIIQVSLHQKHSCKNFHFGYNVKTRQLTKIEDIDMEAFEVWPHTISLVSLPITPA